MIEFFGPLCPGGRARRHVVAFSGVLSQVGFLMIFGVHKYLILRNGAGTYVAASTDSRSC